MKVRVGDTVLIRAQVVDMRFHTNAVVAVCKTFDELRVEVTMASITSVETPAIEVGDTVYLSGFRDNPGVVKAIIDDSCVVKLQDGELDIWLIGDLKRHS